MEKEDEIEKIKNGYQQMMQQMKMKMEMKMEMGNMSHQRISEQLQSRCKEYEGQIDRWKQKVEQKDREIEQIRMQMEQKDKMMEYM